MTPLVFVHGFMGGSAQWSAQAPLGKDRELIRIDLPGFGRNAHLEPINRIEDFARWVLDDLSAIGVDRFDLLGHSMGGMVVQEMVRLAPERVDRLVLYATGTLGVMPGRFETIETSMERARQDGAEATARRIAANWFLKGKDDPEYVPCADLAAQTTLPAILAGLSAMQAWSGEAHLEDIGSQTLVLWGDRDRAYPWSQTELLWRGIRNAQLAVVPNCGHAIHAEAPQLFNMLLDGFLTTER